MARSIPIEEKIERTYFAFTYLWSHRPNDKMSGEQLEQLAPWSETAKANCQN